jgi:hypothetical protein
LILVKYKCYNEESAKVNQKLQISYYKVLGQNTFRAGEGKNENPNQGNFGYSPYKFYDYSS